MRYAQTLLSSFFLVILLYDGVDSRTGGRGARSSSCGFGCSSRPPGPLPSLLLGSSTAGSKYPSHYGPGGRSWHDRYYGNTVVVMSTHTYYGGGSYYYGGGGAGRAGFPAVRPTQLTVTIDIVRSTLFPGDPKMPSDVIFNYANGTKPQPPVTQMDFETAWKMGRVLGDIANRRHNNLLTDEEKTAGDALYEQATAKHEEIVFVSDPTQPVMIENIAYFWGTEYLPEGGNGTDCVHFQNDAGRNNFCNVSSMKRCRGSLKQVYLVGKKYELVTAVDRRISVKFENGTSADAFVWLCRAGDKCYGWECAHTEEVRTEERDPPDEEFIALLWLNGFCCALIFVVVVLACCFVRCIASKPTPPARPTTRRAAESAAVLVPLTATPRHYRNPGAAADYPRPPHTQSNQLDYARVSPPPAYTPQDDLPYPVAYGWLPSREEVGWRKPSPRS